MSVRCLMNGLEVNYPCSPVCLLFGDCVTAFNAARTQSVRTNADRIRAMSDEELAAKLCGGISSDACDYCEHNPGYCDGTACKEKTEMEIVLDWLRQPVKDGDNDGWTDCVV